MSAIELKNLVKKYQDLTAVNNLCLEIEEGELISLLGVNGAGKTTTIKILSGLIKPTSGDAIILGNSIHSDIEKIKEITNVSPQETAIAGQLSVKENLEFMASIYGTKKEELPKKVEDMITKFKLEEVKEKKAKKLSGGWQRRLSIAMALISNPQVLFLDEPTLGLDVIARRELWHIIENLKKSVTIILTTHYMEEAEALSDRIAIMSKGSLKAYGTVSELKDLTGKEKFEDAFIEIATEVE